MSRGTKVTAKVEVVVLMQGALWSPMDRKDTHDYMILLVWDILRSPIDREDTAQIEAGKSLVYNKS